MAEPEQRVVLTLEGADAQRGLPLTALENFVDRFSRALVDFDRSRTGHPTRRTGRRTAREELLLAFRVIGLNPGSAIIELEPVTAPQETPQLAEAEMIAVENLRSFLDAVRSVETPIDPDVTQSIEAARRALGQGGRIGVALAGDPRERRRVTIDQKRVEELASRRPKQQEIVAQVTGQLTMVDIEPPFRVAIRATNGVKWNCRYPQDLEERITSLLKKHVIAHGTGVRVNAKRGYFEIAALEEIRDFEQTELFTTKPRPLDALLREQNVLRPQGWAVFADPEWQDDPASAEYLDALLPEESED
jgi:hypothetical protein